MSLSRTDVEKIAHLARLEINEQEAQTFADSLSQILSLIEQIVITSYSIHYTKLYD